MEVIDGLIAQGVGVYLPQKIREKLPERPSLAALPTLEPGHNLPLDFMVSVGGDGTLLDALQFVYERDIPILGINTGRMGFLASAPKEEAQKAIQACLAGDYSCDIRSVLSLSLTKNPFAPMRFALNECTFFRRDISSLVAIRCFLDGKLLNTYWGDGVMVSTPTGSTAYSMSCGGPLLTPRSKNFIITPINPHNLAARPLVIPDDSELTFEVQGHEKEILVSLDARTATLPLPVSARIKKHSRGIKLVSLSGHHFIDSLRGKLNWGLDKRN